MRHLYEAIENFLTVLVNFALELENIPQFLRWLLSLTSSIGKMCIAWQQPVVVSDIFKSRATLSYIPRTFRNASSVGDKKVKYRRFSIWLESSSSQKSTKILRNLKNSNFNCHSMVLDRFNDAGYYSALTSRISSDVCVCNCVSVIVIIAWLFTILHGFNVSILS